MSTKRCGACFKKIEGKYIEALNDVWHEECFVCAHCKKSFPNGKFHVYRNQPYCKADFEFICPTCSKVIDTDYVTVGDEKFHPECVKCCICRKPVKKYELHKGKVYCPEDYELELKAGGTYSKPATHGVRCAECAREILYGDPVVAEGNKYHDYCFLCEYCKNPIKVGSSWGRLKGKRICSKCQDFICHECDRVIEETYVTIGDKKIHTTCLKCVVCHEKLNYKSFFKHDGKPMCKEHYDKALSK